MTRIACDARALIGPQTGVGTWTVQIMGGLARMPEHRVLLAASKPFTPPPALRTERVSVLAPPRLPLPGTLWLHAGLGERLQAAGAEVWVASLAVAPRRCPVPTVLMVHDLTPRSHAHRHTLANRFCFNAYLEESLERAAAVVVGSSATRSALESTFPWLRAPLYQISYGVDESFSPAPAIDDGTAVRQRFSNGRPYLLHLGTIEPRKGLHTLLTAWELLQERLEAAPDLVLAGLTGWNVAPLLRRFEHSRFRQRLHLPGYVSDDDALALLRHAAVFTLPSEAEGFGLPLAEALSCGTPCVASDIPPLREVAAGAALHSPGNDAEALARTIVAALEPATASRLRAAALARAANLRWQPQVERWHRLLQQISRR